MKKLLLILIFTSLCSVGVQRQLFSMNKFRDAGDISLFLRGTKKSLERAKAQLARAKTEKQREKLLRLIKRLKWEKSRLEKAAENLEEAIANY